MSHFRDGQHALQTLFRTEDETDGLRNFKRWQNLGSLPRLAPPPPGQDPRQFYQPTVLPVKAPPAFKQPSATPPAKSNVYDTFDPFALRPQDAQPRQDQWT